MGGDGHECLFSAYAFISAALEQVLGGEKKPIQEWRASDVANFLERVFREDSEEVTRTPKLSNRP